jgi:hypothetical protein
MVIIHKTTKDEAANSSLCPQCALHVEIWVSNFCDDGMENPPQKGQVRILKLTAQREISSLELASRVNDFSQQEIL